MPFKIPEIETSHLRSGGSIEKNETAVHSWCSCNNQSHYYLLIIKRQNSCLQLKLLAKSELLLILVQWQINFNIVFHAAIHFILHVFIFHTFCGWVIFLDPAWCGILYSVFITCSLKLNVTNKKKYYWY